MTPGSKGLTLQAASLSPAAALLAENTPTDVYDKFRCRGVAPDRSRVLVWILCKTIDLEPELS